MKTVIAVLVLLAMVAAAIRYMIKAKKRGVHCIGCPDGGCCSGCCSQNKKENSEHKA